jgi:hypothetical protein
MAPYRTVAVPDPLYRSLVWLDVRLGLVFCVGLPLVLLIWAAVRREGALQRLLAIHWKVASLLLIALLLLTDQRPLGFVVLPLGQLLVLVNSWFWVDLNEELADLPPWRALPLSVRIWRWGVSLWAVLALALSATALACGSTVAVTVARCAVWLQPPLGLHSLVARLFGFVFGGEWTPPVAAFIGYLALVAYAVGLLQWLLVRLPRQGRLAGGF